MEDNETFLTEQLGDFFYALHFTNPRKVKKVLNRFMILKSVKDNLHLYKNLSKENFPDYLDESGGNYFETVLTIYFILALEFEPRAVDSIFNIKKKQKNFHSIMKANLNESNFIHHSSILQQLVENNYPNSSSLGVFNSSNHYRALVFTFLPLDSRITSSSLFNFTKIEEIRIEEITLPYRFLFYLIKNKEMFADSSKFSDISLSSLKNIIERVT